MVAEDGVGEHIDAEDRGERFQSSANPLAAKRVIGAGLLIDPGEEGSSDASLDSVDDADVVGDELFISGGSGHRWFPPLGWSIAIRVAGSSIMWVAPIEKLAERGWHQMELGAGLRGSDLVTN